MNIERMKKQLYPLALLCLAAPTWAQTPAAGQYAVAVPEGATLFVGTKSKHFVPFTEVAPLGHTTADGTTALTYARDNAMRSLMLDKIARSELIVFNRAEKVNNDEARQELHRLVRQVSRRCDIAYEFADGSVAYDDIPDPLPFDVDAPIIEIGDDDFGIWYLDCQEDPQKYVGKTVRFLAQVCQTSRAGKNSFVPGRFAMTCCVQDIQFVGFPCVYDGYKALEQRSWVTVTARVGYKFHNIYRGKGPVLSATTVEPAHKPLNDVVTFS